MILRDIKPSFFSRLRALFCKPFDNAFSLEKFAGGRLIMIGDRMLLRRWFLPKRACEVVALSKHRHLGNFETEAVTVAIGKGYAQACSSRLSLVSRKDQWRDHWRTIYDINEPDAGAPDSSDGLDGLDGSTASSVAWSDASMATISLDFSCGVASLMLGQAGQGHQLLASVIERVDVLRSEPGLETAAPVIWLELPWLIQRAVYASALLGKELDSNRLLEVAREIRDRSQEIAPFDWTDDRQDNYLSAVRMAMIAGDMTFARELLASKRSFSKHKDQRGLLKKLARKSVPTQDDPELVKHCRQYLDFVRRPHCGNHAFFGSASASLEWAILIERFIERPDLPVDLKRAAAAVYC